MAIALSDLPSKPTVIAAGRRQERLDELKKEHKLETIQVDVNTDATGLKAFVDEVLKQYPDVRSETSPWDLVDWFDSLMPLYSALECRTTSTLVNQSGSTPLT